MTYSSSLRNPVGTRQRKVSLRRNLAAALSSQIIATLNSGLSSESDPRDRMDNRRKFHDIVDSWFVGSQVFPSRSSHNHARSSPARTRSSIRRCGNRNVCGTNTGDCGFGVPAPVTSRASGITVSVSDFLFILVDLNEYIVGSCANPLVPGNPRGVFIHLSCPSV